MDFEDVMRSRRAVNCFDPGRDVPEAGLRRLPETAARLPSRVNLRPWRVAALRDPDQKAGSLHTLPK